MSSKQISQVARGLFLALVLSCSALTTQVAAQSAAERIQTARTHLQQGRSEEAFTLFAELLETDPALLGREAPEGVELVYDQVVGVVEQGDFEKGRYWMLLLSQAEPEGAAIFGYLGVCSSRLGHAEEAKKAFQRALELDEENPHIWAEWGIAQMRTQDLEGAEKALGRSIELGSERSDVYLFRGVLLQESQRKEEADALYSKALELDPESALGWYLLGASLSKDEQYRDALEAMKKAVKLAPTNPEAHYALGHLYVRLGEVELYREQLKTLQEMQPERAKDLEARYLHPEKLDDVERINLDALPL